VPRSATLLRPTLTPSTDPLAAVLASLAASASPRVRRWARALAKSGQVQDGERAAGQAVGAKDRDAVA
jgi:hypothetical protein